MVADKPRHTPLESAQIKVCEETSFSENIGKKMLKSMGWTGGGLGKNGDGIIEPVSLSPAWGRAGIGLPRNEDSTSKERTYFQKNPNQISRRAARLKSSKNPNKELSLATLMEKSVTAPKDPATNTNTSSNSIDSPKVSSTLCKEQIENLVNSGKERSFPAESDDSNDLYISNVFLVLRSHMRGIDPFSILKFSVRCSNLFLIENYINQCGKCICILCVNINGCVLKFGEGEGCNKKDSRKKAAANAIENLLQKCYTLEIMNEFDGSNTISVDLLNDKILASDVSSPSKLEEVIPQNDNDLEEEISTDFKRKVKVILDEMRNQLTSKSNADNIVKDIVFSPNLSNVHRKYIHVTIRNQYKGLGLKSVSIGGGEMRSLTIRVKMNPKGLIRKLLLQGGTTESCTVHRPGTLSVNSFFKR